ncbi:cobalt-precorrin-6A reductase [Calothrix sp. UHCC 0171]|uniref:cobalt-precorrin-6A reductase n=1 Tax=Calothrix sp. UHCC 0171 TaxID=3110245 RepID=UPI002B20609E|nr:cobalt-precorrin-6A reductase [Calothrix sp. UHCC 0171]MEA5571544.1 cobalt-precorrin-6A reductase [Calothrix sp. UHCC 0171]
MKRILILGGTGDASALTARVSGLSGIEVITSLAGRTKNPLSPDGIVRIGGFGGVEGLVQYLRDEKIHVLIDATHPYAAQISGNAAAAAQICHIPHLMFVRPEWEQLPGDDWIGVDRVETAAMILSKFAKRVFLTVGRQQLAVFADLDHIWFLMRLIDPPAPDALLPQGEILSARGPFNLADERKILREYGIDTLVSKNSGGNATYGKIIAARELGIKVVMVQRPPTPDVEKVSDIEGALEWLRKNCS